MEECTTTETHFIPTSSTSTTLEDGNIIVDLGAVLLGHALTDPHDIAALLLLQLQIRVEDAKVELLHERVHVQLHLVLEELVLQRLVARIVARPVEQGRVLGIVLGHSLHLLVVVGAGQRGQTVRVHLAAARVQLSPVVLGQLRSERVDRDDDRTTVSLELERNVVIKINRSMQKQNNNKRTSTHGQDLAHNISSGAAEALAELVEGLQVRLVQRIPDDFDVHLVQVLLRDAVDEEGRQRRVDQHGVVQLGGGSRDVDGLHLLEAAQRVTLGDELVDGALVERARDQQDDVVDHVAVRDEVQERGQRLHSMIPQVLELNHELLAQLVVDGGHGQGRWLVGQELAVVGALQVQLQVCGMSLGEKDDKKTKGNGIQRLDGSGSCLG